MALVTSYDGRRGLLGMLLPYLRTLTIRLYTAPIYPHVERPTSAYTQASFVGYEPLDLDSWGAVYLTDVGEARVDHDRVQWRCTETGGDDVVYGYYVTDPDGRWLWAERDERGGQEVRVYGTIYSVVPSVSLGALCSVGPGDWGGGVILGGSWLEEV